METKHSGLGIASFIISILAGGASFLLLLVAGIMEAATPGGVDEESAGAVFLGLLLIGTMILNFVALGLGVGGLYQRDRLKIFAILGVVFSSLTLGGVLILIVLGNMAG